MESWGRGSCPLNFSLSKNFPVENFLRKSIIREGISTCNNENSKWKSFIVLKTNFAVRNLQLSVGNYNFLLQLFKITTPPITTPCLHAVRQLLPIMSIVIYSKKIHLTHIEAGYRFLITSISDGMAYVYAVCQPALLVSTAEAKRNRRVMLPSHTAQVRFHARRALNRYLQ